MNIITTASQGVRAALIFSLLLLVAGCAPTIERPFDDDQDGVAALARGYSLLDSLLSDESSVADILVIKSVNDEVARLLKSISKLAKADRDAIRKLYPLDPPIDPSGDGLPRIETDARTRIRNQQTGRLLLSGGEEFEVLILLTQEKATDYLESICRSLASADPQGERRETLQGMADGWRTLNRRTRSLFAIKKGVEIPKDDA